MAYETFTGLSGSGLQAFVHSALSKAVGIHITAHGILQTQLEPVTPARWAKFGYFRTYNRLISYPPFDDGYYLNRIYWLDTIFQLVGDNTNQPLDVAGADGFWYYLYPGVTATFWWSY